MSIDIKCENLTIASWGVYSDSAEKLVIPRIGECVCFRNEYYIVQDVVYSVNFFTAPPTSICIFVKKKNDEKDKKSSKYE